MNADSKKNIASVITEDIEPFRGRRHGRLPRSAIIIRTFRNDVCLSIHSTVVAGMVPVGNANQRPPAAHPLFKRPPLISAKTLAPLHCQSATPRWPHHRCRRTMSSRVLFPYLQAYSLAPAPARKFLLSLDSTPVSQISACPFVVVSPTLLYFFSFSPHQDLLLTTVLSVVFCTPRVLILNILPSRHSLLSICNLLRNRLSLIHHCQYQSRSYDRTHIRSHEHSLRRSTTASTSFLDFGS